MKRLALLVVGLVAVFLVVANLRIEWRPLSSLAQQSDGLRLQPAQPAKELAPYEIYARAAQAVYRSVVNIDLTQRVQVRGIFDDIFDIAPRYREAQSHGSGVIITRDGYILTNEHVVGSVGEEGRRITVSLTDGRRMPGIVVGADHQTDVALVKVEGRDLPAAPVGTVRGMVPGQMVVAIGNPLDLRFTVTNGVVSALNRPIQVEDRLYSDLIQHDALINPGNSGGPLVNMSGQVVGINTLIRPDAQGIGFAIPIDTALSVANDLKRFGKVKRPWLGVVVATNSPYFVRRYGVPEVEGVVVLRIYRGSPAAEAGFEPGDVITKIAGRPTRTEDEFKSAERSLKIGERIEIEWHTVDGPAKRKVTVGEAP